MRSTKFRVDGELPPKKDGATSMWGKPTEARRLIALRQAALRALGGQPPLEDNIHLSLTVHVGPRNDQRAGDLDNYVTGVCDGLMAAAARASIDAQLRVPELSEIHPSRCIAIRDDSAIVSIRAEKLFGRGDELWFEIVLEGD